MKRWTFESYGIIHVDRDVIFVCFKNLQKGTKILYAGFLYIIVYAKQKN